MSERVAVIGSGVAGISAAYHLRADAELTIFERDGRPGGHANTVAVREGERELGIDTAFLIFNATSYPQLSEFFRELGVAGLDHSGGFNFFDLGTGVQYGTPEMSLQKEQVEDGYPDSFVALWKETRRFWRKSQRDFVRGRTNVPLGEWLDESGFSDDFKHGYVILLATAVWSIPPERIWDMPAATLIAFFMLHDAEGLGGRGVEWKTVADGSRTYVRRALEEIDGRLALNAEVLSVRETDAGVEVLTSEGAETFDYAVVATHADEALRLIDSPRDEVRELLSKVEYNATTAVLHRDASVLPPERERWQSWNYGRTAHDGGMRTYLTYWMNKLQGFEAEHDYFVTLDCPLPIRDELVIERIPYTHPVVTVAVRDMQQDIYALNEESDSRIKLCGSYFHSKVMGPDLIASHEAAFSSGVEAAKAVRAGLRRAGMATG